MEVIELEGVTRRFGELTAVDDVSFAVDEGEIVGMLGHNGAGKTTLIRVINGLLQPNGGQVRVRGTDPTVDGHTVRRHTGVLTEYPALDDYLTVRENLEVYAAISGVRGASLDAWLAELLTRLGLDEKAANPARDLSAGLKQRVALARALVHDPTILLLDEPTTNMDPVAAREVRQLILELVRERGRTVLLSTHNLAEAEAICDRVAIMRHGRLLAIGRPADLRQQLGDRGVVRIATTAATVDLVEGALPDATSIHRVDEVTVEVAATRPVPEVVAALVRAGVEVARVEPLAATLEDLYVALHDADAQATSGTTAQLGATVAPGAISRPGGRSLPPPPPDATPLPDPPGATSSDERSAS